MAINTPMWAKVPIMGWLPIIWNIYIKVCKKTLSKYHPSLHWAILGRHYTEKIMRRDDFGCNLGEIWHYNMVVERFEISVYYKVCMKMLQHIRCLSWMQVHVAEWTALDLTLFLNDLACSTKQLLVKTHTSISVTGFSPSLLYLLLISNGANENSSAGTKHIHFPQFPPIPCTRG